MFSVKHREEELRSRTSILGQSQPLIMIFDALKLKCSCIAVFDVSFGGELICRKKLMNRTIELHARLEKYLELTCSGLQ